MSDYTSEERLFAEYVQVKDYVMVKDPVTKVTLSGGWPLRIALDAEEYVIVAVDSYEQLPMGVDPLVTMTGSTLKDEDGNYLVQVPASWCNFLTSSEADDVMNLIKIDQHLLASV